MIESIHNRMLDTSVIIWGIVIASAFREFCVHVLNTLRERDCRSSWNSSPPRAKASGSGWSLSTRSTWSVPRSCDLFQYACISALFPLPPVQMELPLLSHGFHKPSPCSQISSISCPHASTRGWRPPLSQASCLLHSFLYTLPYAPNSSTTIAPNALYGFPPLILLKLPQLPHTRGLAFSPCCLCSITQNPPFMIPAPPSQRKSIFPFQPTHVIQRIKRAIQISFYLLY